MAENDGARTRYWFDTESMEDGGRIELLSIGVVFEDQRESYAEHRRCAFERQRVGGAKRHPSPVVEAVRQAGRRTCGAVAGERADSCCVATSLASYASSSMLATTGPSSGRGLAIRLGGDVPVVRAHGGPPHVVTALPRPSGGTRAPATNGFNRKYGPASGQGRPPKSDMSSNAQTDDAEPESFRPERSA